MRLSLADTGSSINVYLKWNSLRFWQRKSCYLMGRIRIPVGKIWGVGSGYNLFKFGSATLRQTLLNIKNKWCMVFTHLGPWRVGHVGSVRRPRVVSVWAGQQSPPPPGRWSGCWTAGDRGCQPDQLPPAWTNKKDKIRHRVPTTYIL